MSGFSFPERPAAEIAAVLAETGIADVRPEDLSNPTPDLVASIYSNFLSYVDPLGDDSDSQIGFSALEMLDNPDHHAYAIRIFNLYRKVKDLLESMRYPGLNLRDLLRPDSRRTIHILSTVVNFIFYREEKLKMLQPIVEQFPEYDEQRVKFEQKINEMNKAILEHEVSCQEEEPVVQQLDTEVKELRQTIQNYNKQQMNLKTVAKSLKEKIDAIEVKIPQADFELLKHAQENSTLLSKIVQSPDKLQRALEEKRIYRSELKNSERLTMQNVQEKTSTLELYSKVHEKLTKHLSRMQSLQEQVNSAKALEKDVKTLKTKLSDEEVAMMAVEAKIRERQAKANHLEELIKAEKKDKDIKQEEETLRFNTIKAEWESKLQNLEIREKKVEATVVKAEQLMSEANLVRETAKIEQQEINVKSEEVAKEFGIYSSKMNSVLETIEMVEK